MRTSLAIIVFTCLGVFACNKNTRVNDDCEPECRPDRVCTEEFKSLMVEVVDRAGSPVMLDSFVVVRLFDSQPIINNSARTQLPGPDGAGFHLLFSDQYKDKTSICGEKFQFEGYTGKRLVVSRTYTIAHDCCHVNLKAGDTKIVIDQ